MENENRKTGFNDCLVYLHKAKGLRVAALVYLLILIVSGAYKLLLIDLAYGGVAELIFQAALGIVIGGLVFCFSVRNRNCVVMISRLISRIFLITFLMFFLFSVFEETFPHVWKDASLFNELNLIYIFVSVLILLPALAVIPLAGIAAEKKNDPDEHKVRTAKELFVVCIGSENFRLLLNLVYGFLVCGVLLSGLFYMEQSVEMPGVYEFLSLIAASFSSALSVCAGILLVARKEKAAVWATVKLLVFALIFFIACPIIQLYIFAFAIRLV